MHVIFSDSNKYREAHAIKRNECHPNFICINNQGSYNCSSNPKQVWDDFTFEGVCSVSAIYFRIFLSGYHIEIRWHLNILVVHLVFLEFFFSCAISEKEKTNFRTCCPQNYLSLISNITNVSLDVQVRVKTSTQISTS